MIPKAVEPEENDPSEVEQERRKLIRRMAGVGMSPDDMALLAGVSLAVLYENYTDDIVRGKALARLRVKASFYKLAIQGNAKAAQVWLEVLDGWTRKKVIERRYTIADAQNLTDEELIRIVQGDAKTIEGNVEPEEEE